MARYPHLLHGPRECVHELLMHVNLHFSLGQPFQLFTALDWVTIPATVIASFIFFGFLVAGEEIESQCQITLTSRSLLAVI